MNIIEKTITEFEQVIATGLVDASLFNSDLNTLRLIQKNCLQNNNLASTKILARQLSKVSSETRTQIEAYVDQLKHATPLTVKDHIREPDSNDKTDANITNQEIANHGIQRDLQSDQQQVNHQTMNEMMNNIYTPTSQELLNLVFELSKQIGQLQEFLTNINDKNSDIYFRTLDSIGTIKGVFKEIEVLTNDVKQSESLVLNAQIAIHNRIESITESITNALINEEVIKTAKIRRQELENLINEIKNRIERDIDTIYEKTKRNADIIALEIVEQAQQKAIVANKEYIAEVNAKNQEIINKSNKKNTNLILFGLLFAFIMNLFAAGFVAKLVANYTSNSINEYISKSMNEHQQDTNTQAINKQRKK